MQYECAVWMNVFSMIAINLGKGSIMLLIYAVFCVHARIICIMPLLVMKNRKLNMEI